MNRGEIALYYNDVKRLTSITEKAELVVTNCGYFISENSPSTLSSSQHLDGYLLIYQHKGRIKVQIKNKSQVLNEKTVILVRAEDYTKLTYLNDPINERYYVYFEGSKAQILLSRLKLLDRKIFTDINLSEQISIFHNIISDFKLRKAEDELHRTSMLFSLLTALSSKVNPLSKENQPQIFSQILYKIEYNYFEKFNIEALAHEFSLSVATLSRQFKKYTGQSPAEYINSTRLNKAKILLIETSMSVSEIAYSVGFEDALYFSRFFKKNCKVSPKTFRKNYFSGTD